MDDAMQAAVRGMTAKASQARRTRRGRKRLMFQPPSQMPPGVKDLWNHATAEERDRAHRTMVVILEVWMARLTRAEAAEKLGIPPVRVHQLSQQATSGMLAGLLRQPRPRKRMPELAARPSEDPTWPKGENRRLERELAETKTLVSVLRDLPLSRMNDRGGAGRKDSSGPGSKGVKRKVRKTKPVEGPHGRSEHGAPRAGGVAGEGTGEV